MPRVARTVAKGYPHHITQRGNYRQEVFETDADYLQYLEWLKQYGNKYGLDIWAYCLMNNHVHFVCVPKKQDSLSRTFNTLHMRYSQHVNRRKKVSGHLWQGRFYSTILDEAHAYASIRYVENNPVRAGVVKNAEDYPWSSARDHVTGNFDDAIVSNNCYLLREVKDWRRYLHEREDERMIDTIRKGSLTGRPSGEEGFVKRLEKKFGRRLKALPHGRPKKTKK